QERAQWRGRADRERAAGQGAEAARLRQELEGLLRRRERLDRRLRSLRRFHDYLWAVLAKVGQFQDIPAMLAHFGALVEVWAALAQQAEAKQEQLAQGWAQLQQQQEGAGNELLHTQDELAQLHARLEAAHQAVLQEESHWAQIQSRAAQKTLMLGQIKLAVLNLFQLTTEQLQVPTDVALEDTKAQLEVVSISPGWGDIHVAVASRSLCPQVLLCIQDLAEISTELCPRQPGPCPPHSPSATSMHPLHLGGAGVSPIKE
ncbi:CC42M protein, partial [Alcedo cyanopectus]|nr:CC42M protein [Ceyx cyanopectus]